MLTMTQYPVPLAVERYCCAILLLFFPFRSIQDMMIDGSFHKRFLHTYPRGMLPHRTLSILSNVQMFYNSMKLPAKDDPLSEVTTPFKPTTGSSQQPDMTPEDDAEGAFDVMLEILAANHTPTLPPDPSSLHSISLDSMRKEGARGCGFHNLPSMNSTTSVFNDTLIQQRSQRGIPQQFLSTDITASQGPNHNGIAQPEVRSNRDIPNLGQLMELTFKSTRRQLRPSSHGTDPDTDRVFATGSVLSILQWSEQPHLALDTEQQLAFQIVTAAVVLTYYDDAKGADTTVGRGRGSRRHAFICEKKAPTTCKIKFTSQYPGILAHVS